MPDTPCPKCGGRMAAGFVTAANTGASHSYTQPEIWVAGPPEPSFWTGSNVKGHEHHPLVAHRCEGCGFLELYANG